MTAQVHERLILDGEQTSMASCPQVPADHPRIESVDPLPDAKKHGTILSTGCWRQYIGTWEIRDGRFYLKEIIGRYHLVDEEPLFADWYTGTLVVPRGEQLQYVHMGFESVYEQEWRIDIRQGMVTGRRVIDNRGRAKR